MFWEKSDQYPAKINEAVGKGKDFIWGRLSETQRDCVLNSWDFRMLAPIFLTSHVYEPYCAIMGATSTASEGHAWMRRIAKDAINRHPKLFFKRVFTNTAVFFRNMACEEDNFLPYIGIRLDTVYVRRLCGAASEELARKSVAREYALPGVLPPPKAMDSSGRILPPNELRLSWLWDAYCSIHVVYKAVFASYLWIYASILVYVGSILSIVSSKGRNPWAFAIFLMLSSVVGSCLVVALSEWATVRYSYPIQFIYYISVLMSPLLLSPKLFRLGLQSPSFPEWGHGKPGE